MSSKNRLNDRRDQLQLPPSSSSSSVSSTAFAHVEDNSYLYHYQRRSDAVGACRQSAPAASQHRQYNQRIPSFTAAVVNGRTSVDDYTGYWSEDSEPWLDEQRREESLQDISLQFEKINMDFLENRESIYADKMAELHQELKQLHDNTHVLYLEGLSELEAIRDRTLYDGRLLTHYQERRVDCLYNEERHQAEEGCLAELQKLRDNLFAALEEKRRKLKEDKDNHDISFESALETQARLLKRNLRRRGMDHPDKGNHRRKQTPSPGLISRLKDEDLHADLLSMHIDFSEEPPHPAPKKFSHAATSNRKR